MAELKTYEDRYDYTVRGKNFDEGFEDLITDLSMNSEYSQTIYLDTKTGDIDAMASCDFGNMADTYHGINIGILDWNVDSGYTRMFEAFETYELEDFLSEEELKNLKKEFEEEEGYSEDWNEDKEEFYRDYCSNYVKFLLDSENKKIDEGVEAYARDTANFYKEQFDKAYAELLEKGYC